MTAQPTDLTMLYAGLGIVVALVTPIASAGAAWGIMRYKLSDHAKLIDSKGKLIDDMDKRLTAHGDRIQVVEILTKGYAEDRTQWENELFGMRKEMGVMAADIAYLRGKAEADAVRSRRAGG